MTSKKLLCACVGVVLVAILCAGCAGTPTQSKVGRADFERDATSGDSKLVMICTGSVAYYDIKLGVAMSFMEIECSRQGIHVLTRSDFEDKVRAVLKKNGADSIKLQYKDDGTTKTITVAP